LQQAAAASQLGPPVATPLLGAGSTSVGAELAVGAAAPGAAAPGAAAPGATAPDGVVAVPVAVGVGAIGALTSPRPGSFTTTPASLTLTVAPKLLAALFAS
jgi:hypothetical protein